MKLRFAFRAAFVLCVAGGAFASASCGGGDDSNGAGDASTGDDATFDSGRDGALVSDAGPHDASTSDVVDLGDWPKSCDAGGIAPVVTGTTACPSDENRAGCACPEAGVTAACWTADRTRRGHGTCQDGVATCTASGSVLGWSECEGEVIPTGSTPPANCVCMSNVAWNAPVLSPCFVENPSSVITAVSSSLPDAACPPFDDAGNPVLAPTWTTDTLQGDCTGAYTICYTLKAGDPKNMQPTDCTLATVCTTQAHYEEAGATQTLPSLPSWITDGGADLTCGQSFAANGGYAIVTLQGQSDECVNVSQQLPSVSYCPLACGDPSPPPICATLGCN